MKAWIKLFVVAIFAFVWCYLAFSGLVKLPELDIAKSMTSESKSSHHERDWKKVNLYEHEIPKDVNKKDVIYSTGTINIEGINMFYRKVSPPSNIQPSGQSLLLLHGRNFKSETWEKLGTLHLMASLGHLVVAVDLPGYGETTAPYSGDRSKFIASIIQSPLLSGSHPVLISPSMSGEYSVMFVGEHSDLISGYIPVAPVATSSVPQGVLRKIQTPTLIMYGANDNTPMAKEAPKNLGVMPNSQEVVFKNCGHAAYLDEPDLFHKMLYNFMKLLHD
ncbi:putative protein-lysine deacylase ABHD14B isoform X2 [Periplaneta americana]|uniref:putative protein-lysine deacylase ABHD14B isoform X2 n=1 Tax=Periplaneta americana TaxID=6978 RepID=UPI0037E7879C